MSNFRELDNRVAAACFKAFGEAGATVIEVPGALDVPAQVIVNLQTRLKSTLGDVLDPRPSAEFLVAEVGDHPRGSFDSLGRSWTIGRPVDGGNDGVIIKVWIEPCL